MEGPHDINFSLVILSGHRISSHRFEWTFSLGASKKTRYLRLRPMDKGCNILLLGQAVNEVLNTRTGVGVNGHAEIKDTHCPGDHFAAAKPPSPHASE